MRLPYWLHRLLDFPQHWYDLKNGVANFWAYKGLIWTDRDWDWDYAARLLEFKLRRMSRVFKEHGHLVSSDRSARQTLICAHLLKRLREDEYCWTSMPFRRSYEEQANWPWHKHYNSIVKQDEELLLRTLRHMRSWWD